MMMLLRPTNTLRLLNPVAVRSFGGGGHGHGHGEHHHHKDHVNSIQVDFKHPSQEDLEYQLPKKGTLNEKIHQEIAAKWAVDRDDILDNTKYNKYSSYHLFGTVPLLQNKLVFQIWQSLFARRKEVCDFSGFSGVTTHENGIFLYKSPQASSYVQTRIVDYFIAGCGLGFVMGASPFFFMPFAVACMSLPRKMAQTIYFTYHAELHPHTEQVVFSKVDAFGMPIQVFVDIRNLVKVNSDECESPLLWDANMFDGELVFKDTQSQELFVFDKSGIWNQEALEHPLLY